MVGVLLLGMELLLRLAGFTVAGDINDTAADYVASIPLFVAVEGEGGAVVYRTNPAKRMRYRDQSFEMPKPEGTLRVFCLGGSSVWGMSGAGPPLPDDLTIPARLAEALAPLSPGRRVEVISVAAPGLNSTQLAVRFPELTGYAPDLFVFYTGHNEWAGNRWDAAYMEPSFLTRLRLSLSGSRVMMLVESVALRLRWTLKRWSGGTPGKQLYRAPPGGPPTEAELLRSYQRFEENLASMVAAARAADAGVVLCTISSNLLHPPHKPVDPETGGYGDEGPAMAAFQEGLRLQEAGRLEEAAVSLDAARETDLVPLRAKQAVNARIRAFAAAQGVPLADVEAALVRASRDGIPGFEMFVDSLHPSPWGNRVIADCIADTIASAGL